VTMNVKLMIDLCRQPPRRLPVETEAGLPVPFQIVRRKSQIVNAFTIIELMMVVAIMGLVLAMGMPAFLSARREAPLRKAVNDVMELAGRTRSQAILKNEDTMMVFHPLTKEISSTDADTAHALSRNGQKPVTSVQLPDSVDIKMLDVNLLEGRDSDEVDVHFHPNGTCDEMTLVLTSNGEYRRITLEPTTALAHADDIE
jgi:prepilin-type N-terminal cleavage/methylation domain-containing protein